MKSSPRSALLPMTASAAMYSSQISPVAENIIAIAVPARRSDAPF